MYADTLKSQINSLRHQLDLSKRVHEADLRTCSEDFERKIDLSLKDKNYSLSLQRDKISDLEKLISEEKSRSSLLKQELSSLNSHISQELSSFSEKKKLITEDVSHLTQELHTQRSHIQLLQHELMSIERDYDQSQQLLSSKFESNYAAMSSQTANNQAKLRALESEIAELQRKLRTSDASGDGDIKTLEEALRSTYHTVELQAFSIDKLRKATEESLKEAAQHNKQKLKLEEQEKELVKENARIKEAIDKLERKIYGRSTRNH